MSTITKQAVQAVADLKAGYTLSHADVAILNELARIALASLEAEPVCVIDQSNLDYLKSGSDADVWPASRTEMGDVLLYRAAPPAPVSVPAAMEMDDDFDSAFEHGKAVGWNAYRAAMLHGAENAESRCTIKTAPALDSLTKNAESRCGNSPVIPEGWVLVPEEPTHEMLEAGDEQFGTYDVYRRMIEAAPKLE
ncbi:hypothetical protein V6183_15285 [Enterobacter hormaechei]|uniref:hypothetical protein n=1 Tax=Enterobacter hormaechei TaxID=158836 RepID=UPI00390635DB